MREQSAYEQDMNNRTATMRTEQAEIDLENAKLTLEYTKKRMEVIDLNLVFEQKRLDDFNVWQERRQQRWEQEENERQLAVIRREARRRY